MNEYIGIDIGGTKTAIVRGDDNEGRNSGNDLSERCGSENRSDESDRR